MNYSNLLVCGSRAVLRLVTGFCCELCHIELDLCSSQLYPLCDKCATSLALIHGDVCVYCGLPLLSEEQYCLRCRERDELYHSGNRSLFMYQGAPRRLLAAYKFKGIRSLARLYAEYLFNMIIRQYPDSILIPVPSNPGTIKARGWGQTEEIVGFLEKKGVQVNRTGLVKLRGQSQKNLNREKRFENSIKLFACGQLPGIKDKDLLLFDDVYTTGATLDACAYLLQGSKPRSISCVTLYRD